MYDAHIEKNIKLNGDFISEAARNDIFLPCFNRLIQNWYHANTSCGVIDGTTDSGKEILSQLISEAISKSVLAFELIHGYKVDFVCINSYYGAVVSAFRIGIRRIDKDEYIGLLRTSNVCTQPYC